MDIILFLAKKLDKSVITDDIKVNADAIINENEIARVKINQILDKKEEAVKVYTVPSIFIKFVCCRRNLYDFFFRRGAVAGYTYKNEVILLNGAFIEYYPIEDTLIDNPLIDTYIHEYVHWLANYQDGTGKKTGFEEKPIYQGINEAATEFITENWILKRSINPSFSTSAYADSAFLIYAFVKDNIGIEEFVDMYFSNDFRTFKVLIESKDYGNVNLEDFLNKFNQLNRGKNEEIKREIINVFERIENNIKQKGLPK